MTVVPPQMIRASRQVVGQAAAARSAAVAGQSSAKTFATAAFVAPRRSAPSPRTASSSASFSTSILRRAEQDTQKAKQQENEAGAEAMGAEQHKPADEKAANGGQSDVEKQLTEKDNLIRELKDKLLYSKADLQNAQRRAQDEKAQASEYAITKLARDLTSSLDILHLALRSVPEPMRALPEGKEVESSEDPRKALSELYSGVELTSKSILDMLKTHGVTAFDPTGEKFNPNEHEAMYQAPVPGKEAGTVLDCSKIGFKIKGRILRAAQVGVVQSQ